MQCRYCSSDNPHDFRYCGRCGSILSGDPALTEIDNGCHAERKHVTILFSDLSDYTRISENHDPEDIQMIMGAIFEKSRHIINGFGGSVERFLGDEIMAIFGHPIAHEDDAVRAINAAREIHRAVEAINQRGIIAYSLQMHTGINTGMVITNDDPSNRLSLGITGDAANLAKRIQAFARPGEIMVGRETYRQSAGYFNFDNMDIQPIKGRSQAVSIYHCIGPKREPRKVRRVSGRQAELIAREKEIAAFNQATEALKRGCGGIICLCGEVGTGKSRLVEEFSKQLSPERFLWCEGYAYEFTQNNSYFPLIDLIRRQFSILDEDPPATIRNKISHETSRWIDAAELSDIIGGLFALERQGGASIELIDPDNWKSNLHRAMAQLFDAMAAQHPLVVCFEDLHWSDPSTIDLLRSLISVCSGPILFLLVFRPDFVSGHSGFMAAIDGKAVQLPLEDLSPPACGRMVCSLLGTARIPDCLQSFLGKEIPGNPFFLEEAVNALVESTTIVPFRDTWVLQRPLDRLEIARSVRGIIASRIDRLDAAAKQILREASVIGSVFPLEILSAISRVNPRIDACLEALVNLDLIRIKRGSPTLEYCFKHVLIREVVYDGILKAERRVIHTRIALCIENLFAEHLPEHFETLAYHFKNGAMIDKAIVYLMHAGRKSLRRYAVEESHRYYQEAFGLIGRLDGHDASRNDRLIEILVNWFPVYYYRGRFGAAEKLMGVYLPQAHATENGELRGMFFIGYGMCLWARERFQEAYEYMQRALDIGQSTPSRRVEGYAHAWMIWICIELGRSAEAIAHGESARHMADHFDTGHYPYYRSFDSLGVAHWMTGDCSPIMACSRALFEYGNTHPSSRVSTWAHFIRGVGQMTSGSFKDAKETMAKALVASTDPLYTMFLKLFLAIATISDGDYVSTRELLGEVMTQGQRYGCEVIGTPAALFLSISRCVDGNMKKNVCKVKQMIRHWEKNGGRLRMATAELALGEFYLNLRRAEKAPPLLVILRNLPFLATAVPLAARRAEGHYRRAIVIAQEIGAKGIMGQAYLGMARLFHHQGKRVQAMASIERALALFEQGDAAGFIRSAGQLKAGIGHP